MIINFHKDFTKRFKLLPKNIQIKFKERLIIFEEDQSDAILNNHALKGKYLGYRSINVTGDIRAIYKKTEENVIFIDIDSHSNLYK